MRQRDSERFDDDLNTRKLASAVTLDVMVDYQLGAGVSIYGAVDNVLNADVQTGQTADGIYSYGPPQLWRIGLASGADQASSAEVAAGSAKKMRQNQDLGRASDC